MIKSPLQHDPQALAARIRREIRRRGLKPGDRLPVHPELARSLKVGIRRLREALSILKQQGFIRTHGKGGTRVASPSIQSLADPMDWHLEDMGCSFEDLVRSRALIESAIASEAARVASAKAKLMILHAIEQEQQATATDRTCLEQLDEAFHQAVLQAADNPALTIVGRLIAQQFQRKLETLGHAHTRYRNVVVREHYKIYEAIHDGNSVEAQSRMRRHIEQQLKRDKPITATKERK